MAYTKTTWQNGDLITAAKLNNIEDEVETLSNSILDSTTHNVAVGSNSLAANTTGTQNTAIGDSALISNTSGSNNTAVGKSAGANITTGSNNTVIGWSAKPLSGTNGSVTIVGRNSQAGIQGIAVGVNVVAQGMSVSIGDSTTANTCAVALGAKTKADYLGSVAIGSTRVGTTNVGATASAENEIVLGTQYHTVKIPGNISGATINDAILNNALLQGTTTINGATLNSPTLQSATIINGGTLNTSRLNNPNIYDPIIRATNASFVYGDELVTNLASWTSDIATYDEGWIIPEGGVISGNVTVEANKNYLITLIVKNKTAVTPNEYLKPLRIALGDDEISIFGGNDANWNVLLTPSTGGTVVASIGGGEWYGTITGVSIKEIAYIPDYQIYLQGTTYGIRVGSRNVYIGNSGSELALADGRNVGIGVYAQQHIKTGTANVGIGEYAQQNIKNGSYNVAIGKNAQQDLTIGMYNYAIGYSSQHHITTGSWNVAMGNESQNELTTGNNNVSLGRRAHNDLTTGNKNVAVGAQAGFCRATDLTNPDSTSKSYATKTGEEQVLIGFQATQVLNTQSTANGAIAVGARAMANTDGIAIGRDTRAAAAGSVAIGKDSQGNSAQANNANDFVLGTENHRIILAGKIITFNADHTVTWEDIT